MNLRRATVAVMGVALLAAPAVTLNVSPVLAQQASTEGECSFEPDSTVDVLLLLDQSLSLQRTDETDQRVPGAKAVVNAFASLAQRISSARILVAGFGTNFDARNWVPLTRESTDAILREVESFAERDTDWHTDYTEALHGAVQAFSTSSASCKILYWFTDGEHDIDPNDPRFPREELPRSYPAGNPATVTLDNLADIEARMPSLVCGDNGYAEQLGRFGVRVEVQLLGTGEAMDDQSRRVLQGMGGDPGHDCGPGKGSFSSVENAADLPYEMACSSQFGLYGVRKGPDGEGMLAITRQDIDSSDIPASLSTEVLVIASPVDGTRVEFERELEGSERISEGSGPTQITTPVTDGAFSLVLMNVERACVFVTVVRPEVEVLQATPTLYQDQKGEFTVLVSGPRGEITGSELDRIEVEPSEGQIVRNGERKVVEVAKMPSAGEFELAVTASVGSLSTVVSKGFTVNPPSNSPTIMGAPQPIDGEGTGPFHAELQVDGRDGGTLCLENPTVQMEDADATLFDVTAALDGEECVEASPDETQSFDLTISTSRQADADDVLVFRTVSTPSTGPQVPVHGVLNIDLRVLPVVNSAVLVAIVAGMLLVLIGLLWAVLYGVNRLVARIPDVRRNKVRFGEFRAQLTSGGFGSYGLELLDTPKDNDLRVPRADSSQLKAGRLTVRRRVPVRPWVAPYAEMTLDTDFIAARMGTGASQNSTVERRVLRSRSRAIVEPVVMVGISEQQVERANGSPQPVHGVVLFDSRSAKGQDAGAVVAELIRNSLVDIAARLPALEQLREKG